MPTFDLICLANSRKMQGRCVAGLRTDGAGWIRPVARTEYGELYSQHYKLSDGSDAQVLDLIRIEVISHKPETYQPENWLIEQRRWELLARSVSLQDYTHLLQRYIVRGPSLFGNVDDRINVSDFDNAPASASLALVTPQKVTMRATTNYKGKRQIRATFNLGGTLYDLVVTDPIWEQRLANLQIGQSQVAQNVMLVISLGEPFNDSCYKLIATVIEL